MAFSLKKVINGELKIFSLKSILQIFGQAENDEILLNGDAYRISSFVDLGGSGNGANTIWVKYDIIIEQDAQSLFVLSESIIDTSSVSIIVNGVVYQLGKDNAFKILDRTLTWNGGFALETSDTIQIQYRKTI